MSRTTPSPWALIGPLIMVVWSSVLLIRIMRLPDPEPTRLLLAGTAFVMFVGLLALVAVRYWRAASARRHEHD